MGNVQFTSPQIVLYGALFLVWVPTRWVWLKVSWIFSGLWKWIPKLGFYSNNPKLEFDYVSQDSELGVATVCKGFELGGVLIDPNDQNIVYVWSNTQNIRRIEVKNDVKIGQKMVRKVDWFTMHAADMTIDSAGNIFVCQENVILKITDPKKWKSSITAGNKRVPIISPACITVGRNNTILFLDRKTHSIKKLRQNGIGYDDFHMNNKFDAMQMTCDRKGNIFIADSTHDTIHQIDCNNIVHSNIFERQFKQIHGLTCDRFTGSLYVVDSVGIWKINPSHNIITSIVVFKYKKGFRSYRGGPLEQAVFVDPSKLALTRKRDQKGNSLIVMYLCDVDALRRVTIKDEHWNWAAVRAVLVGWYKNKDNKDCFVPKLPREILEHIMSFLKC